MSNRRSKDYFISRWKRRLVPHQNTYTNLPPLIYFLTAIFTNYKCCVPKYIGFIKTVGCITTIILYELITQIKLSVEENTCNDILKWKFFHIKIRCLKMKNLFSLSWNRTYSQTHLFWLLLSGTTKWPMNWKFWAVVSNISIAYIPVIV